MLKIDRLDIELLGVLARNARAGIVELASTLGVARNTVQARLTRMTDDHLLSGFRPELDLTEIGIAVQAFMALELQQGQLRAVVDALTSMPEILEIHATTGREDLLVRVATATQADLQNLIQEVVSITGVSHSNTTLALTTPLPYRIQPLLEHLGQQQGWGRSTPAPR
ncbi:Lrp/AsnC family transcriptional regulator [Rhodococcoides kyotonense]|uniref:DNA-binding transcriptional regulator, Lrp family n=1 Tax=Rhodococcoides kyotonense TaxID=398843 RepID=A0A239HN07_9NOCA|nr:Lrp/AsnC family transcriptional regulator [Rhodococcus kyotonensis]SNS82779.1 DNA-binding transcriptional regulator, Lrp family [Rhodococcus kyotonensis]